MVMLLISINFAIIFIYLSKILRCLCVVDLVSSQTIVKLAKCFLYDDGQGGSKNPFFFDRL